MGSRFSDFLFSLLPFLREVIHHIVTVHIPCFAGDEDKRLWIPDNHGIFSTKSAVDVICYQKSEGHSLCLLLSPASFKKSGMPLKSSFLVLRAIQDRLPLDINIQRLGISLASKCICCPESAFEEVTLIFIHGSWVVQLWTHYQNIFQLDIDTASVLSCLPSWFTIPLNSTFGYLQRIVPILVFNELWRARNAAIFEVNMKRLSFVLHLRN